MTESTAPSGTTNASGKSRRTPRSKRGKTQIKTKIVVRRLPANLPEQVFLDSIKSLVPEENLSRAITWFPGKVSKNPIKGNTLGRAYLYFKTELMALDFQRAYHGHLFKDRQGNEGRAQVEFAPFQKAPRDKKKVDIRQGTIEKDPDYKAFLESLNAEPVENDKEAKLSNTEILLKESAANPKSTPLLEALRAQKAAAQAAAQAARQARQANKQITILSKSAKEKAAGKQQGKQSKKAQQQAAQAAAASSPSSSSTAAASASAAAGAGEATPKKERRRRDRKSERVAKANGAAKDGSSAVENAKEPGPIQILKPKAANKFGNTPASPSIGGPSSAAAPTASPTPARAQPEQASLRRQRNAQKQQQQQQQQSQQPQQQREKDVSSSRSSAGAAEGPAGAKAGGEGGEASHPKRIRRGRGGDKAKKEGATAAPSQPPSSPAPSAPSPSPAANAEGGEGKARSRRRRGGGGGGGSGQKQAQGQQQHG
ncbi:hypothetical protein BGZ73_001708 [Actinomortierella ambigua]|nr:hypothetical protein BGZ73_001708 [Actinomortierella ambigua]